jgi:hypothetical protein
MTAQGLLGSAYRLLQALLKVFIGAAQTGGHFARELNVFDLPPH